MRSCITFDGKRLAFADFVIQELDDVHIKCIASGERRNRNRHRGKLVVKAVTYHQLRVVKQGDHWIAECMLILMAGKRQQVQSIDAYRYRIPRDEALGCAPMLSFMRVRR